MKRAIILLLVLLLVSMTGCGGRLASRLKDAATARSEAQPVMSGEVEADRILFRDTFEDGNLDGWQSTASWPVRQESDTKVMVATGTAQAAWVPEGAKWTNYYVRASVKLESGAMSLAFRVAREGRYWLLYRADGLYLLKEFPKGNYTALTQTEAPALGAWHALALGGYGGHLQVYVGKELQMDYVDADPISAGTIGVAVTDNATALVDNVLAVKLLADLPAVAEVAAALPVTVAPPSASDLEEGWDDLGDWGVSEGPVALVQPTVAAPQEGGGESGSEEWQEEQSFEQIDEPSIVEIEGEPPVIDYFYAEAVEGEPGCYYLHWDLHGADSASLNDQGITAPGSGQTCEPGTYTLVAQNAYGTAEETVIIDAEGDVEEPPQLPDLFIGNLFTSVPDPDNPNEVLVEIRVRNGGPANSGPFTIRWYPHQREDIVGCSIDVPQLELHATNWWRCTYTYPAHEFGTMHWRGVVDEEQEIAELNDDNNVVEGTVDIARAGQGNEGGGEVGNQPDLLILNARFEPSPVVPGQSFRAVMVVRNAGSVAVTEPFSALWHFHADLGVDDCVWNFGGGIGPTSAVEVSCERTTNVGAGQAPTWVTVDTDNVIDEGDEINNDVSVTLLVAAVSEDHPDPSAGKPDLVIEDAHFEPVHPVPGEDFQAVMTIRNSSGAAVTQPFVALWEFHPALGVQNCRWTFDNGLGAGAAKTLRCTRNSNVQPGQAPTSPTVDADNVIDESDEVNNDASVTLILYAEDHPDPSPGKPDLVIEDAHFEPVHPVPGEDFQAVMTVRNNSGAAVTQPFVALWEFHAALGVQNCRWTFDNGLGAGAAKTLRCTRNSNVQPGQAPTSPTVDADNVIDESDEINNDASVTLILYATDHPDPSGPTMPDLVIRNLMVSPLQTPPGGALTVSFDVVNQGTATNRASKSLWHSGSSDQQALVWDVPALAAGASHHIEVPNVRAPSDPGHYAHSAIADSASLIDESSESNNKLIATDKLVVMATDHPDTVGPADLVIRDLKLFPNPVVSSQDLLIEFDVVNQGAGPAAASAAQWSTPPGAGLSFRCNVPALQEGASFHCSWQLTAPSRKAGYGTKAIADVDNAVNEGAREDNNSAQETLKVQ